MGNTEKCSHNFESHFSPKGDKPNYSECVVCGIQTEHYEGFDERAEAESKVD